MKAVNPAKAGELVGAIYDAALDSTRWPAFMENLSGVLNAGLGMLWMHDFSDGSANFENGGGNLSAVTGLDAAALSQYSDYYTSRNVWIPHTMQFAAGHVTVTDALYPHQMLRRTEFYNDWLHRNDLFRGVGCAIVKQDTRDVKLSFVRSERAGPYGAAELRLFRHLIPHVRNAVALHQRLYRLQSLSLSALAALDLLPMGVILLTGAGTLMHANRRAYELASSSMALRFAASGAIHASTPAATASLKRLIGETVRTGRGKGLSPGGALRLVGTRGDELHVMVMPLSAVSSPFGESAPAALFCSNPRAAVPSMAHSLRTIYRMTPAEADLTQALVSGLSLQEYALARGVTINTARTQLKSSAAKTGARRQADLVRMVLTGPAVLKPILAGEGL
jgi:DNA-binding CsgD family transcriptional regulator